MALATCAPGLAGIAFVWLLFGASPEAENLSPPLTAEVERLAGHQVTIANGGYTIDDIAGDGPPIVGVIERRGEHLILVSEEGPEYRLAGVLAKPRIAGPGYKVWALGPIEKKIETTRPSLPILTPRRLGILAPPKR